MMNLSTMNTATIDESGIKIRRDFFDKSFSGYDVSITEDVLTNTIMLKRSLRGVEPKSSFADDYVKLKINRKFKDRLTKGIYPLKYKESFYVGTFMLIDLNKRIEI